MKFDNVNLEDLRYTTPYFLLSESAIREKAERFYKAFSEYYDKIKIYYSVKTNYELEVLKIIKDMGFGAEISGRLDLFFARKAEFEPSKIVYDGPCKSEEDLKYAIHEGIGIFNMDSITDAKNLDKVFDAQARNLWGGKLKVGLRVNPELKGRYLTQLAEMYIGKFGVPISQAEKVFKKLLEFKNFEVVSIHTHIGSQILSPKPYVKTLDKVVNMLKSMEKIGVKIEEINLGGGFPSDTLIKTTIMNLALSKVGFSAGSNVPEIEEYANNIMNTFLEKIKVLKSEPYLAFEPGRYIASKAGLYISKVVDVKDDKWVFIDGSISHVPENIFFASRRIQSIKESENKKKFTVCGSSLNTGDIFSLNCKLPKNISVGDLVFIQDCGAYTFCKANQFIKLRCPIYLIRTNGKIKMIRREEEFEDINRLME